MLTKLAMFTKSPEQALVDRINFAYGLSMALRYVRFGVPVALDLTRTEVTVSAIPYNLENDLYLNSHVITYNRYQISDNLDSNDLQCQHPNPTTTQALVDVLIAKYGLVVTLDDFIVTNIVPGSTTATLHAKAQSLRWVGSATFTLVNPPTNTTYLAVI